MTVFLLLLFFPTALVTVSLAFSLALAKPSATWAASKMFGLMEKLETSRMPHETTFQNDIRSCQ